ncbi:hypothetical protein GQ42DRAFT_160901 [Ramicandelaber brevisporus]|nr:hypothetical protein GQ42DRAFT_160901 [Ramicandelaber brevisporus]
MAIKGVLRPDPAIERWSAMKESLPENFRLSPRSVRFGLIFVVAIPLSLYAVAKYKFANPPKWGDIRKGDNSVAAKITAKRDAAVADA